MLRDKRMLTRLSYLFILGLTQIHASSRHDGWKVIDEKIGHEHTLIEKRGPLARKTVKSLPGSEGLQDGPVCDFKAVKEMYDKGILKYDEELITKFENGTLKYNEKRLTENNVLRFFGTEPGYKNIWKTHEEIFAESFGFKYEKSGDSVIVSEVPDDFDKDVQKGDVIHKVEMRCEDESWEEEGNSFDFLNEISKSLADPSDEFELQVTFRRKVNTLDKYSYTMPLCEPTDVEAIQKAAKEGDLFPAVEFARDMMNGLRFLHDEGIVHRDIKAKNIWKLNGSYVLGDFDLSRYVDKLIPSGMYVGTEPLISPGLIDFYMIKVEQEQSSTASSSSQRISPTGSSQNKTDSPLGEGNGSSSGYSPTKSPEAPTKQSGSEQFGSGLKSLSSETESRSGVLLGGCFYDGSVRSDDQFVFNSHAAGSQTGSSGSVFLPGGGIRFGSGSHSDVFSFKQLVDSAHLTEEKTGEKVSMEEWQKRVRKLVYDWDMYAAAITIVHVLGEDIFGGWAARESDKTERDAQFLKTMEESNIPGFLTDIVERCISFSETKNVPSPKEAYGVLNAVLENARKDDSTIQDSWKKIERNMKATKKYTNHAARLWRRGTDKNDKKLMARATNKLKTLQAKLETHELPQSFKEYILARIKALPKGSSSSPPPIMERLVAGAGLSRVRHELL